MKPNTDVIELICKKCGRSYEVPSSKAEYKDMCTPCYAKEQKENEARKLVALESIAASLRIISSDGDLF